MIAVIDNYDSFTWNLVYLIRMLGFGNQLKVLRNDSFSPEDLKAFSHILISPGPGIPSETTNLYKVLEMYAPSKSILGICLGHQGIGEFFGAKLVNLDMVRHGVRSEIHLRDHNLYLFRDIPESFSAGLYHSWVITPDSVKNPLKITAQSADGLVMGISHSHWDVHGLQFHPESIMSPDGKMILENWLRGLQLND